MESACVLYIFFRISVCSDFSSTFNSLLLILYSSTNNSKKCGQCIRIDRSHQFEWEFFFDDSISKRQSIMGIKYTICDVCDSFSHKWHTIQSTNCWFFYSELLCARTVFYHKCWSTQSHNYRGHWIELASAYARANSFASYPFTICCTRL